MKTIGKVVLQLRTQNRIQKKDLCDGLCSVRTLERIENEEQLGDKWILEALLGRMGKTTANMEYYLSSKDYGLQKLRNQITTVFHSDDSKKVSELLMDYSKQKGVEKPLHSQFLYKMQALLCGEEERTKREDFLNKALLCTVPQFYEKAIQCFYLSEEEINLIVLLAGVYEQEDKNYDAYQLYKNCFEYLQQNRISEDMKLRCLPSLALHVAEQAKKLPDKKTWEEVTDQTIHLLKKHRRLHCLPELMILRAEVMQGRISSKEEELFYKKELQYAFGLKEIQKEYAVTESSSSYVLEESGYYSIGKDIAMRRKALGKTQLTLTENEKLCTIRQLSNIETGKSKPEEYLYHSLMRGLGVDESFYEKYVDMGNFTLDEKRYQLDRCIAQRKFAEAEMLFHDVKKNLTDGKADMQYQLFIQSLLDFRLQKLEPLIVLQQLEEALAYSLADYKKLDLVSWSLSRNEVRILNGIAFMYAEMENVDMTIHILSQIMSHYETNESTLPHHVRLYEMVLFNLAKYLGLSGEHDDAITIADKGIKVCMQSGDIDLLPAFLYSKTWNIGKKVECQNEMSDSCKKYLKHTYLLFYITEDIEMQNFVVSYYLKRYHETLQIDEI